jgi:hypothetical protein
VNRSKEEIWHMVKYVLDIDDELEIASWTKALLDLKSIQSKYGYPTAGIVKIDNEVFVDALIGAGLQSDGTLPGEYIFATIAGKHRIVRVGSELYKLLLKTIAEKKPNILLPIRTLEVGKVYVTKSGEMNLFLGFISTVYMKTILPKKVNLYYSTTYPLPKDAEPFSVKFTKVKLATLWLTLSEAYIKKIVATKQKTEIQKIIESLLEANIKTLIPWNFSIKKKHQHTSLFPDIHVEIPDNIIYIIKKIYVNKVQHMSEAQINQRTNNIGIQDVVRHYDAIFLERYSNMCNMSPFGLPPELVDL